MKSSSISSNSRYYMGIFCLVIFVVVNIIFVTAAGPGNNKLAIDLLNAPAYVLGPGQTSGRFMLNADLQAMFFIEKMSNDDDANANQTYIITLRVSSISQAAALAKAG